MSQQQQRYRVIERIASGGMAEVYRAESAGLEGFKKVVAIKRVLPHLSEKKKFIGMFLDEARVSAHLNHSNCVQVFDIGVGDNTYFIVMEFVEGADLKVVIDHQRKLGQLVPLEIALLICIKICEGLDYAHRLTDEDGKPIGIVHRDMSPPNVLITRHGEVKIVDFGLAKANSQLEQSEPGIIKGKFSYLSPEAAQGYDVDHRTDIFAVGIILWEMLAGRRLFLGDTDLDTVRQVQAAQVPSIRQYNPTVPPELDAVVQRALARERDDRHPSAQDLANDLTNILFASRQPASSFDIAHYVREALSAREEDGAHKPQPVGSIIGSLIEEALFEFTSLDGGGGGGSASGASPAEAPRTGVPSVTDWGSELGVPARGQPSNPPSGGHLTAGNLADLLEEETFETASEPLVDAEPPPVRAPTPEPPPPSSAKVPPKKGGSGGLIALVLVLVLLGGAAGAYFGGVIPPEILQKIVPK